MVSSPSIRKLDLDTHTGVKNPAHERIRNVISQASQEGSRLMHLITTRGRQSANANRCRTMVSDYLIGLQDLLMKLDRLDHGDSSAAAELPGLLRAFQESFNFGETLAKMRGYGKDRALPAYVGETMDCLSRSFDTVAEAVRPLSESLEVDDVRTAVREQVAAAGSYKFHQLKRAPQTEKPTVQPAVTIATPAPSALEKSYPDTGGRVPQRAEVTGSWLGRFASKVRDTVSEAFQPGSLRLGFAALAVAGCVNTNETGDGLDIPLPEDSTPSSVVLPMSGSANGSGLDIALPEDSGLGGSGGDIEIPDTAPSPSKVGSFSISPEAPTLWHAIHGALHEECSSYTPAQLERETASLVRVSFTNSNSGYRELVTSRQATDNTGAWLGHVKGDLGKYGVNVPANYAGVLSDVAATGNVGAYNMSHASIADYATVALSGYSCK